MLELHPAEVLSRTRFDSIAVALQALEDVAETAPAAIREAWNSVLVYALGTAEAETNRAACGRLQPWGRA